MSFCVSVTFRNFSVRTPERPTTQESAPFWRILSTRIGSLNSAPETICPSASGRPLFRENLLSVADMKGISYTQLLPVSVTVQENRRCHLNSSSPRESCLLITQNIERSGFRSELPK